MDDEHRDIFPAPQDELRSRSAELMAARKAHRRCLDHFDDLGCVRGGTGGSAEPVRT